MEDDFFNFLIRAPLEESPSSQYQRFLDERGKDPSESHEGFDDINALEEGYRRDLFDLSLSGLERIDISNLSEGEESTLGDILGDFTDPEYQEETSELEFVELMKTALPALKSAGLLGDLLKSANPRLRAPKIAGWLHSFATVSA